MNTKVKGSWTICNLQGVPKVFKTEDSPEALAWMRNRDPAPSPPPIKSGFDKLWEKKEREEKAAARLRLLAAKKELPDRIETAIAYAMDGGDPMDLLGRWMERTGITSEDLDKVANKEHKSTKGFYGVLATFWDDAQKDSLADATTDPDTTEHNQYYSVVEGKVVPAANPWKST